MSGVVFQFLWILRLLFLVVVPPPVALSPLLPLMFAVGASSVVAIVVLVCVVAVWVVAGTAVYGFVVGSAIEVSVVAAVFTELDLGTAVVYVQSAVSIVRHLSFLLVSL